MQVATHLRRNWDLTLPWDRWGRTCHLPRLKRQIRRVGHGRKGVESIRRVGHGRKGSESNRRVGHVEIRGVVEESEKTHFHPLRSFHLKWFFFVSAKSMIRSLSSLLPIVNHHILSKSRSHTPHSSTRQATHLMVLLAVGFSVLAKSEIRSLSSLLPIVNHHILSKSRSTLRIQQPVKLPIQLVSLAVGFSVLAKSIIWSP